MSSISAAAAERTAASAATRTTVPGPLPELPQLHEADGCGAGGLLLLGGLGERVGAGHGSERVGVSLGEPERDAAQFVDLGDDAADRHLMLGVCWRARPDGKLDEVPPGQVPPRTW